MLGLHALGHPALDGALAWFVGSFFFYAWQRVFIRIPELHPCTTKLDVHRHNFGELPLWDRLFGTYQDAPPLAPRCGLALDNERHVRDMLLFRDVYDRP